MAQKQILGKVVGPAGFSPVVDLSKTGDTLTISITDESGTQEASIHTGEPVNADWNVSNPESLAYIRNKPDISTVATTGDYFDLVNRPVEVTTTKAGLMSATDKTNLDTLVAGSIGLSTDTAYEPIN